MSNDRDVAARLVRRTGFGATGQQVDAAIAAGPEGYVARMLAADLAKDPGAVRTPPPEFDGVGRGPGKDADADAKKQRRKKLRASDEQLTQWWLRRMLAVEVPFSEKMTFVWHSHFATSLRKVKDPALMLRHNQRQRTLATGTFSELAYAMLTDGATQRWLDNNKNTVNGPNENLSREFMEIFTLGHADGYTEQDVREGARALTGYKADPRTGIVSKRDALHDAKPKTLFGKRGDFDAADFCNAVLGRPGSARYVVTRLYSRLVSDRAPDAGVLNRLVDAYGERRDVHALLTAMFTDPSFAEADGDFVIGPVEWLVGAMRAVGVTTPKEQQLKAMSATLDALGQLPLYPPSVGGWPGGPVWLSTAAAELRFKAASRLAHQADLPTTPGSVTAKLEALAYRLGVASWSSATLAVLKGAAADPRQLVTVALNTPEYLVH